MGALRGVAQTISYEIRLALILFTFLLIPKSLSIIEISLTRMKVPLVIPIAPLLVLWIITAVAETNRTPFDFAEGESELVSGFNTEYGGAGFAIIFMAEYGIILLFSALTASVASTPSSQRILSTSLFLGLAFF